MVSFWIISFDKVSVELEKSGPGGPNDDSSL